jgi:hypothetical protein
MFYFINFSLMVIIFIYLARFEAFKVKRLLKLKIAIIIIINVSFILPTYVVYVICMSENVKK